MKLNIYIYLSIFLLSTLAAHSQLGFYSKESRENEKSLENRFIGLLDRNDIGEHIHDLSSLPHPLGSERGHQIAQKLLEQLKGWGWDASIETYWVLFPTPKVRVLELLSPYPYKALLTEFPTPQDPYTAEKNQLPPYNAWSADGEAKAGLIFVNYGLAEDYAYLDRQGISVKGRIVIAKYGYAWRGIKVKLAQQHGALATILYSDPKDDGYAKGDSYPRGAFKNEYSVQRGSVMDMVVYPGDPLTPGYGAEKSAPRIKKEQAANLLKIPVLPISYHDALPLLRSLAGQVVPEKWQGALPITYHIGDGKSIVHLKALFNWNLVPAYDIIAKIKGVELPDEWVIRGNHHDAWVHGASDPVSGLSALLEEAKAIGKLKKSGWAPKRTIVYTIWDGEEPSLLGSTEWAEQHQTELKAKAVAYINSDNNGRGIFFAGGSHELEPFINQIAKDVQDPEQAINLLEKKRYARLALYNTSKDIRKILSDSDSPHIEALGTGSDFSPFLQHLGIPSLNLSFKGEDQGGEYHTNFDTYNDFIRFKDPGFKYAKALSEVGGIAVLRLSQAEVLPFSFHSLFDAIDRFDKDLSNEAEELRALSLLHEELRKKGFLNSESKKDSLSEIKSSIVPPIDFSAIKSDLIRLDSVSFKLQTAIRTYAFDTTKIKLLNERLRHAEQSLLSEQGLPNRPWYKHVIYAPGFYTGYGVKTLPGPREAIEEQKYKEAESQIQILSERLEALSDYLELTYKKILPEHSSTF